MLPLFGGQLPSSILKASALCVRRFFCAWRKPSAPFISVGHISRGLVLGLGPAPMNSSYGRGREIGHPNGFLFHLSV
jgi:hypothetical protein